MNERGEYHVFPSKFFCIRVPKKLIGNSSVLQKLSGSEKFYGCKVDFTFPDVIFLSDSTEKSRVNPSMFQKFSGVEIFFWEREGAFTFFRRLFLSHVTQNFHWNSSVFQKNLVAKKLCRRENEVSSISVESLCITVSQFFIGTSSLFQQNTRLL